MFVSTIVNASSDCRNSFALGKVPNITRRVRGVPVVVLSVTAAFLVWGCVQMAGPCTSACISNVQKTRKENQERREEQEALKEKRRKALAAPIKPSPLAILPCGDQASIDDGEDGDDALTRLEGRTGKWHTTRDSQGVNIDPAKDATFRMSDGGANGSRKAARVKCTARGGVDVRCGLALDFKSPPQIYDASAYGGISFIARSKGNQAAKVIVHVRDANTERESDLCLTCGQYLGAPVILTDNWLVYTIAFNELKPSAAADPKKLRQLLPKGLYGISWDIILPKGEFELWVDDVKFTGCPEPPKPVSPFLMPSPVASPDLEPAPLQVAPPDSNALGSTKPATSAPGTAHP